MLKKSVRKIIDKLSEKEKERIVTDVIKKSEFEAHNTVKLKDIELK